jgi:hypothetical protein
MGLLMRRGSRAGGRALCLARLAACGLLSCLSPVRVSAADPGERLALSVKAAFVYKFQIYVGWPQTAFPSADAPFLLCIVGATPAADLIERAVHGQTHDSHPIVVERLSALTPASHCHEAVIGPPDPAFISAQLAASGGFSTLTITDTKAAPAGVINFVIVDDTVRFAINEAAAGVVHLSVSSKLLRLAVAAGEG